MSIHNVWCVTKFFHRPTESTPYTCANQTATDRTDLLHTSKHHTHTNSSTARQEPIYVFALDASPTGVESGMLQAALEAIRANVEALPGGEKGQSLLID